jgi:hypothetical protein
MHTFRQPTFAYLFYFIFFIYFAILHFFFFHACRYATHATPLGAVTASRTFIALHMLAAVPIYAEAIARVSPPRLFNLRAFH